MKKSICASILFTATVSLVILTLYMTGFVASTIAQTQRLEKEPLEIVTARGNFKFAVEVADQPHERTIGLMNRVQLDPNSGMLFVFDRKQIIAMWMKNTLISLDMIFIDEYGIVKKIAPRTVPHSLEVISSDQRVNYVLELGGGIAAYIGLAPGDRIKHRLFNNTQ